MSRLEERVGHVETSTSVTAERVTELVRRAGETDKVLLRREEIDQRLIDRMAGVEARMTGVETGVAMMKEGVGFLVEKAKTSTGNSSSVQVALKQPRIDFWKPGPRNVPWAVYGLGLVLVFVFAGPDAAHLALRLAEKLLGLLGG